MTIVEIGARVTRCHYRANMARRAGRVGWAQRWRRAGRAAELLYHQTVSDQLGLDAIAADPLDDATRLGRLLEALSVSLSSEISTAIEYGVYEGRVR